MLVNLHAVFAHLLVQTSARRPWFVSEKKRNFVSHILCLKETFAVFNLQQMFHK